MSDEELEQYRQANDRLHREQVAFLETASALGPLSFVRMLLPIESGRNAGQGEKTKPITGNQH